MALSTEVGWSGLGCGEQGRAAALCSWGEWGSLLGEANDGAAGGESVLAGKVGEPVGFGVTTGMGMTVMGMEGGGREGGMGAGQHSVRSSSDLETLLMRIDELQFTPGSLCSVSCSKRIFSFSSFSVEETKQS